MGTNVTKICVISSLMYNLILHELFIWILKIHNTKYH